MPSIRFFNAQFYDPGTDTFSPGELLVDGGIIAAVARNGATVSAEEAVDCGGAVLLPGFIDTHLHLPGSYLYERHGVNLMDCDSLASYQQKLLHADHNGKVLRGFGWNQRIFQQDDGALPAFQTFLSGHFPHLPVILFSDDYHSCICNRALLDRAASFVPAAGKARRTGLLKERALFSLLHHLPELSFQPDEIRDALLAFQAMLFSRGITAVQTLMPIGMDESAFRNALQDLSAQGLWKLHTRCALTVHPADAPDEIVRRYRTLQEMDTATVSLGTVKLYVDGVVDNGSAYLQEPYCSSTEHGYPIWSDALLHAVCTRLDKENIPIHAHVIGDAAAAQIVGALSSAMRENGHLHNENHHVLAHLQLADPKTVDQIGSLSLFCALQPFWFPCDEVYPVDQLMLGARIQHEYPCASLLHSGARVTFGSDSPVTGDPSPLCGMACAMARKNVPERLTFSQALDAYTAAAARQLSYAHLGALAPRQQADFVLIHSPAKLNTVQGLTAASVERTYVGGSCVYNKQEEG